MFAWRDGEVLKLLRPGVSERLGENEARIVERIDQLRVAAPRFLGATTVDGRFGLVYERVRGPSMLDLMTARPWSVDSLARAFAGLHASLHTASGTGLPEQVPLTGWMIDAAAEILGPTRTEPVRERLLRLAGGTAVCHGDMHPGNVILTPSGPVIIDWLTARCGPPEADIARTLFLLTGSVVPAAYPRIQRIAIAALRRRFATVYHREYRRTRPLDDRLLDLWRLPVLAARLAEGIAEEQGVLLERIDVELAGTRDDDGTERSG